MAHHPAEQRQPRAHKAVLQLKAHPFMQPDTQQPIATAPAGQPAHRARQLAAAAAGEAGEAGPVVGYLPGKGSIALIGVAAHRLGEREGIKDVGNLVPVPGAVRIGLIRGLRNVVEPVAPAGLSDPLLGLHHHVAKGGERHVPAHFAAERRVALHAGIEQLNQPEAEAPLAAQLLDLPGDINAEDRHHAGLVAVRADHHRQRMLTAGEEGLQHRLRQYGIANNGRRADGKRRGQRPERVRRNRPQLFGAGLR